MAIYTYWGNKDPQDGTTEIQVASGVIAIGQYGNFTANEIIQLLPRYDLRSGALVWTKPITYPWSTPETISVPEIPAGTYAAIRSVNGHNGPDVVLTPSDLGSVAVLNAPQVFTHGQTINQAIGETGLQVNKTTGINDFNYAAKFFTDYYGVSITQTADITSAVQAAIDALDITKWSLGDGVFVLDKGGFTPASLPTGNAGADNQVTYQTSPTWLSANGHGVIEYAISVQHVVSGINTPLTVSASGNAVTVNLATDGAGNPTSTAAQVIAAVNASFSVIKVVVAFTPVKGAVGAGVVGAMAATNLANAFTGNSGGDASFNSYVPPQRNGTTNGYADPNPVNNKAGVQCFYATQSAMFSHASAANILNYGGGAAITIANGDAIPSHFYPEILGNAISITDYSARSSVNINKQTQPNTAATSSRAIVTLNSQVTGSPKFSALSICDHGTVNSILNTDGSASFGTSTPLSTMFLTAAASATGGVDVVHIGNKHSATGDGAYLNFGDTVSNYARVTGWVLDKTNRHGKLTLDVLINTAPTFATMFTADNVGISFYNHATSAQQLLATGVGHTVDDIITALQNVGLVKQS